MLLNNPVGFYTFFKREIDRFLKVYLQTLLSPVVSNLLFLAIFGFSVHGKTLQESAGPTYMQFLVPGLIMMGMLSNSFQNSSSSLIIRKYNGTLTDLLVLPLSPLEITLAFMMSSLLRGVIVGAVTLITSLFFVSLPYSHIGIIIIATFLVNSIFGLLGALIALWAPDFDKLALITNFVITPLTFLGGVFYSINNLPGIFRTLSHWNPFVYMIDSLRFGFLGVSDIPIFRSLLMLTAVFLVLFATVHWVFRTGYKLKT